MWTPNKLFSLIVSPISFPFFFILLRGRLTDDFVLIQCNFECASKEKRTERVNLFKSTPSPMNSQNFIYSNSLFSELGSESLKVDFSK